MVINDDFKKIEVPTPGFPQRYRGKSGISDSTEGGGSFEWNEKVPTPGFEPGTW